MLMLIPRRLVGRATRARLAGWPVSSDSDTASLYVPHDGPARECGELDLPRLSQQIVAPFDFTDPLKFMKPGAQLGSAGDS
jgi:hypothetical protein